MSKEEAIEFIKEIVLELDGGGLVITDQDDVEKWIEKLSNDGFFKCIEETEECLEDFISEDFTDYQ